MPDDPSPRQRDLARQITSHLAGVRGRRDCLAIELPKMSAPALEELLNAIKHLEDDVVSERNKRRRGF